MTFRHFQAEQVFVGGNRGDAFAGHDHAPFCEGHAQDASRRGSKNLTFLDLPLDDGTRVAGGLALRPVASGTDLLFAGYHDEAAGHGRCVSGLFNGKIDRPGLQAGTLGLAELQRLRRGDAPHPAGTIAWWDTAAGYTEHGIGDVVVDRGLNALHGVGYNRPVRAMTGWNWRGKDDCFRLAPDQFGGIYFNDDAIIDCRWQPTFSWVVPEDLPSGVYRFTQTVDDLLAADPEGSYSPADEMIGEFVLDQGRSEIRYFNIDGSPMQGEPPDTGGVYQVDGDVVIFATPPERSLPGTNGILLLRWRFDGDTLRFEQIDGNKVDADFTVPWTRVGDAP